VRRHGRTDDGSTVAPASTQPSDPWARAEPEARRSPGPATQRWGAGCRPIRSHNVPAPLQQEALTHAYLSPEQINRVVRANQEAIRHCYTIASQREPTLRGTILVEWRIDVEGHVTSARLECTTMAEPAVAECVLAQVRRWIFPEPEGGEVRVSYRWHDIGKEDRQLATG
jgi:hypothetical protein